MNSLPSRRHLLLAALASPAWARAQARPVLRCTLAALPPLLITEAGGRIRGLYADFLQELAALVGAELRIQVGPLGRAAHDLTLGASDLTVLLPNDRMGPNVRSLGEVFTLHLMLQPRPGLKLSPAQGYEGLHVVTLSGSARWEALPLEASSRVSNVTSPCALVGMLQAGRADAAVVVRETNPLMMKACGTSAEGLPPALPLRSLPAQLWVRQGLDPQLVQKLEQARETLLAQGLPARLRKRYGVD